MSTPLMNQYKEIKNRFYDCLLFFHLGDFYEMFDDDAIFISKILGLTLTKRGDHPMCGIPVANLDFYIKKLVKESKKPIAICGQTNTPEEAKLLGQSLVSRDVIKIITKGTYQDPLSIDNNFIMSVVQENGYFSICYADFSSGECYSEEVSNDLLISEIFKINPSEILIEKEMYQLNNFEDIITIFTTQSIENKALNMIKDYAIKNKIEFNVTNHKVNNKIFMKFGSNTIKNLEILIDSTGFEKNSLFTHLNKTRTPEGKRILKNNIVRPLVDKFKINYRLDAIEYFIQHIHNFGYINFQNGDLKKLVNNIGNLKILRKIGELIQNAYHILSTLKNKPEFIKNLEKSIEKNDIYHEILINIPESPGEIGEGSSFLKSQEIINLNFERNKLLEEIFLLPNKYNLNCKVKNNTLIGYFIEFTKNEHLPKDMTGWILKQGLATSTRYTTAELINLEIKLKDVNDQLQNIEKNLFEELKFKTMKEKENIENLSYCVGYIDYFQSCAINAIENRYFRPIFVDDNILKIENGRHPILERISRNFVQNDINYNNEVFEILITGPNMGGKSTYLRQNALILIMAHIGMFVPANIITRIFDGVFVRIGSADNISNNESTFMVEMKECSEILNLATEKSFIVLDEVGRGTSTTDGLSICIAICEYIHDHLRCFSLVSTHYNELSRCKDYLSRFRNFKVDIMIVNEEIIFLYKIINGIAEDSFGINVARLANLPQQIINRSKEIKLKSI